MNLTTPPPVGELVISSEAVPPSLRVSAVAERFFLCPDLEALALIEAERPVALVTRNKLFSLLFRRFGLELYGRDPIIEVADRAPLVVPADQSLDRVLDQAMARPFADSYDEVVVVDAAGRFHGLLSVKRLVIEQGNVLAQSLVQREMALTKAREMKKVTDLKSQFIAHVTHELRSPVNAIIGLCELMQLAAARGRTEQLAEKLPVLASSATSLRGVITNILDLSKMEAGRMDVQEERFDLVELVREVAATTRVLVGGKPVTVTVEAPEGLEFCSDAIKVRQVLLNLASNAAKFTEQGTIRLTLAADAAGGATLAVHDTGPGIRDQDRDRLFAAFSQLEPAKTRRHEGTGLGLAITRQLVELLGGEIRLDSRFGQGSTFSVLLPAAIPQHERAVND